ncbi:NAD(P)/FAD-dependent oxidoreductase [Rhizobium leguminosarum]|uniref:NAD(P)/FAD-dependent oxidoreductase n=1 Tax=Rhizobium leguminosarum TaxID=384 RepID=UPI001C959FD4|nr:hypothetical protein [Rhizobium leguminosarum]MBY5376647.1 hypothetical protein [Rhizobium leguminosarum]
MSGQFATIFGTGISGLTAARLLSLTGWTVELVGDTQSTQRWITVSGETALLFNDLWGPDIFQACRSYPLIGRRVDWSVDGLSEVTEPLWAVELSSLNVAMLRRLRKASGSRISRRNNNADCEPVRFAGATHIDASGRSTSFTREGRLVCGKRTMRVWPSIRLSFPSEPIAEVFAGEGFWSFAFPIGRETICLQLATPRTCSAEELRDVMLRKVTSATPLLHYAINKTPDIFDDGSAIFSTAPTLTLKEPLSRRLAIGDSLMTLDPLCGDGAGHGLKSALLATGVLNSIADGLPALHALAHFEERSLFAFSAHLRQCQRYYSIMRHSGYWAYELHDMSEAIIAPKVINNKNTPVKLVAEGINRFNRHSHTKPAITLVPER